MNVYFSHIRSCSHLEELDFVNLFYKPIKESNFAKRNNVILPHDDSAEFPIVKDLLQKKGIDLIIAEVSYPATGQGIELGMASAAGIRIICLHKKDSVVSSSLKFVSDEFIEYTDFKQSIEELFNKIESE